MSIDRDMVRRVASLSRLGLTDEEIDRLTPELNAILGWVEQLGEVDVRGVEPMAQVTAAASARLRDDRVTDGGCRDAVLANAPAAEHGFFTVPKVIE